MDLWILITVAAAFSQNLRSALQKHLKSVMGTTGATFVRFGYGLPVALVYFVLLTWGLGQPVPDLGSGFVPWLLLGATAQIVATFLMLHLFSYRNFLVGSAYSRTEAIQTAILAAVITGATFSGMAIAAILISVVGVMLISVARTDFSLGQLVQALSSRTAGIGIFSGTAFAFASIGYREATLSVEAPNFPLQAATTLIAGIAFQTVIMLVWMIWKDRAELVRVARAWKLSLLVGLTGASASFGWFAAFALQEAALVKVVAQVEILFTFAAGALFFRENMNRYELMGCGLIVLGIVVLLLGG